MTPKREER
jgi:hypothetical protein